MSQANIEIRTGIESKYGNYFLINEIAFYKISKNSNLFCGAGFSGG